MRNFCRPIVPCVAIAIFLSTPACSSNEAARAIPGEGEGSLYVLATSVHTPDITTRYLTTVSSVDAGDLDLSNAVELPGGPVFAHNGAVFAATQSQSIVRFDVDEDGRLVEGLTMSVAGLGVEPSFGNYFASDERAFLLDSSSLRFVVWNPSTMEIITTLDVEDESLVDMEPYGDRFIELGDGRVLLPLWWSDWNREVIHPFASALLLLDTESLTVERFVEAPGCSGTNWGTRTENGDVWLVSDAWSWFFKWIDESVPASCGIRFTGTELAQGGSIDLGAKVGGRPAGYFGYAGDGLAYTVALHQEELSSESAEDLYSRFNDPAWYVYRLSLDDDAPGERVPGIDGASANYVVFDRLEDRFFVRRYDVNGQGRTTLFELPSTGAAQPVLTIPGELFSLERVL